jgi:hypothetical protein
MWFTKRRDDRHELGSSRRRRGGIGLSGKLLLAVVLPVGGFLVFGDAASANTFGGYELHAPCCNGDPLYGTRANISIPASSSNWNPGSAHCIVGRSDAEDDNLGKLIQTGFLRCASGYSLDGTCSLTNNLVNFVETNSGSGYTCYPKGAVSYGTTHKYTVDKGSTSTWTAYIDGVADAHTISMGNAQYLVESLEYTGGTGGSFTASATYGSGLAWQRWNGSIWFTVQSAYVLITSGSGWSVSGGPPNVWSASH